MSNRALTQQYTVWPSTARECLYLSASLAEFSSQEPEKFLYSHHSATSTHLLSYSWRSLLPSVFEFKNNHWSQIKDDTSKPSAGSRREGKGKR